jgi:spore coat protein U-like protein
VSKAWLLALALCAAQPASAATICRIVSGGGVAFGVYDPMSGAPTDTVLNITVSCDRNGGSATVTLTLGLGAGTYGSSESARQMYKLAAPSDYLGYGLFRDAGRSSVWGSSTGINTVSKTLSVPNHGSASTVFTIYGRIPALQNISAGDYSDYLQATVTP